MSKPNHFCHNIGARCLYTNERLETVPDRDGRNSEALATLKATEAHACSAEVRRLLETRLDLCDFDDATLVLVQEFASERLRDMEQVGGDVPPALAIAYLETLEAVRDLRQRRETFDREHLLIVRIRRFSDEALTGGGDDPVHESTGEDRT